MDNEKLNSFSKILIATSAINYMASALHSVNEVSKSIAFNNPIHEESLGDSIKYKDSILEQAVAKLSEIMQMLGDTMNSHDAICEIDVRVTKEAFDIIVHGKDDVNE